MRAVVDHAVEEGLGLDALAHEPALHVRDGHDQGVDAAVSDHRLELVEHGVFAGVRLVAHRPSHRCGGTDVPTGPSSGRQISGWYEPPGGPCAAAARPRSTAGHHLAVMPPSATITLPVTNDDSSEARKSATLAISRGSPGRPIGWNESIVA